MKFRKHSKVISLMLVLSILCTLVVPAFADETSSALTITLNANYYPTQTLGEYKIIFTAMTEIPAFTELGYKITLTNGEVDRAAFESAILSDSDTKDITRGTDHATYRLTRTAAAGISQKTALANLEIISATEVLSATTLAFSDFYIIGESETRISVNPTITFQEGPIVPELSTAEQSVYDAIVALVQPNTVSFYTESGSILALSDSIASLKAVQDSYNALSETEKANVDEVLTYNGYSTERMESLSTLYQSMNRILGVIEMYQAVKNLADTDLLNYQFLFSVYDSVKATATAEMLPASSVAATEFSEAILSLDTAKAKLETILASATHDDKTYACGDQITNAQALSAHNYYSQYLTTLLTQIDTVTADVTANFSGREESKNNLLSYLAGYKSTVQGIQNGVDDIPTMTIGEISRGSDYKVSLVRKNTLTSSSKAEVLIVVYDEDGTEIDRSQQDFPSSEKVFDATVRASKSTYEYNMTVTVKVYYLLDGAQFYIGEEERFCYTTSSVIGGNSGIPVGGTTSSGSGNSNSSNNNSTGNGGTIFPPEETVTPEKDNTTSDVVLFQDISSYGWAKEAIEGLYYAGIVNGMEDGIYNPSGLVTREQFSKMVAQLFGLSLGSGSTNFVDVKADAWYAPYISAAMQAGYIQGQSTEYFGVGESIMRQDMATILYRALGDRGSKVTLSFSDNDAIAPYATDAIAELVGLGVLNGYEDGSFQPRGTATRAEAAKTIWGIYQILNQ